jgi:hypothetical protein
MATSGNGLELMYTKLLSRFVWVATWVSSAAVFYWLGTLNPKPKPQTPTPKLLTLNPEP